MKPVRPPFPFRARVLALVQAIPRGRVMTYGQIALLAGRPRAAREVGWIAHAGGNHLPWQRVVNRFGGLASGYRGGPAGQKRDLDRDGVGVGPDFIVDLARYQWWPGPSLMTRLGLPAELAIRAIRQRDRSREPRRRSRAP